MLMLNITLLQVIRNKGFFSMTDAALSSSKNACSSEWEYNTLSNSHGQKGSVFTWSKGKCFHLIKREVYVEEVTSSDQLLEKVVRRGKLGQGNLIIKS